MRRLWRWRSIVEDGFCTDSTTSQGTPAVCTRITEVSEGDRQEQKN